MSGNTEASVRMAVMGAGEWGKDHVRAFSQLRGALLTAVCDLDEARLPLRKRVCCQSCVAEYHGGRAGLSEIGQP